MRYIFCVLFFASFAHAQQCSASSLRPLAERYTECAKSAGSSVDRALYFIRRRRQAKLDQWRSILTLVLCFWRFEKQKTQAFARVCNRTIAAYTPFARVCAIFRRLKKKSVDLFCRSDFVRCTIVFAGVRCRRLCAAGLRKFVEL